MTPEQKARAGIDQLLVAAGWHVCNPADANLLAGDAGVHGVAIREFALLSGVELQSTLYVQGLPHTLPAWARPLPFVWESTGVETHFTNGLDPEPRARPVFAFFRPELLVQWLQSKRWHSLDKPAQWLWPTSLRNSFLFLSSALLNHWLHEQPRRI